MMKWICIGLAGMLGVVVVIFIAKAIQSQKLPDHLGLQHGVLLPCPASPNCVCSERHSQPDKQHAIAPIAADPGQWRTLKDRIAALGGVIQQDDGHYLHATFSTAIFHYVDDLELRLDQAQHLIHIRSASRVGHSDFGVNRKRVQVILGY